MIEFIVFLLVAGIIGFGFFAMHLEDKLDTEKRSSAYWMHSYEDCFNKWTQERIENARLRAELADKKKNDYRYPKGHPKAGQFCSKAEAIAARKVK